MTLTATILAAGLAMTVQTPASGGWVWTLYEGDGPLVLAHEAPDTPNLQTTLECEPGSGATRLTLYRPDVAEGFGSAQSGDATAAIEARVARAGRLETGLRTDHPVFAAFSANGMLTLSVGTGRHSINMASGDLAKLRRFSELCSG